MYGVAPIDPPRRRSSWGFSQALTKPLPSPEATRNVVETNPVQPNNHTRSQSNVGRKPTTATTPLHRSTASPGHVAKMQRVFSNVQASLQLDMHYAASPLGSIESRLPSGESSESERLPTQDGNGLKEPVPTKSSGWRYSMLPFQLGNTDLDVREPLPEQSPLLPNIDFADANHSNVIVSEPISSGFTSPVDRCQHATTEDVELLDSHASSPPDMRDADIAGDEDDQQDPDDDLSYLHPLVTTELEDPLTSLSVSRTDETDASMSDVEESPIVAHLRRQSAGNASNNRWSKSLANEIFLSTPAKAAADSAKAKRGILKSANRSSSNKENIDPDSRESGFGTSTYGLPPCPNPAAHKLCPDPSAHQTPDPGMLRQPNIPSSYMMRGMPSPSPLRASLQAPGCTRVSASGSPMPMVDAMSAPMSPEMMRQSYFSQARFTQYHPGPPSSSLGHQASFPTGDTEHFQPGWQYVAGPEVSDDKPAPLKYAFSTAAAKEHGSSTAPDSRIRDSYRTDTLTPLAKPTGRYRKIGIGALANRGVSKYYDNPASEAGRGVKSQSRMMASSPYPGPISPRFMSSPPRAVGSMVPVSAPRTGPMKRRRTQKNRGAVKIVDDDVRAGARSNAASLHSENSEREGSVMEIDEDIREAVRLSIIASPDRIDNKHQSRAATGEVDESLKELSPNVELYRRGSAPRRKRRVSYWDDDLKEVAKSPTRKEVMSSPLK